MMKRIQRYIAQNREWLLETKVSRVRGYTGAFQTTEVS